MIVDFKVSVEVVPGPGFKIDELERQIEHCLFTARAMGSFRASDDETTEIGGVYVYFREAHII